jgi:hypothetical protein
MSSEDEALARELAEQLAKLRVEEVILNALVQISSIGYRRLGATPETRDDRDLGQTRLAIETLQMLVPVLRQVFPAEVVGSFESEVASLQLAYVQATKEEQ